MTNHIRRRDFIFVLGSAAAAWPLAVRAQQAGRMKRIGYVGGHIEDAVGRAMIAAFRQGLAARGWVEGRTVEIVARYGAADPDRNRTYAAEMLGLAPDVIVSDSIGVVAALLKEPRTIPIVMPITTDPVARGLAESLARPGGNVTGFALFEPAIATKWLELLREVAPSVARIAILVDPLPDTSAMLYVRAVEPAAASLRLPLTILRVRDDAEIEQAIESFARARNGGLIVPPGPWLANRSALIVGQAARHQLPAVYAARDRAVDGGLISYAPDFLDMFRRSASYVDRILKGAKPADLPIQLPTKYELVVNLKTAKAMGLTISETFLVRADEVIE
jgi:putative tryptophan/tyrosine transport system substrate-binding protein